MRVRSRFNSYLLSVATAIGILLLVVGFVALHQSTTNALSATDYNPGNIIDDSVFYNKDAMNAQQIQDFLNRLIPNCDTWGTGTSEYGGGTRAQYAASRGWPGPPYVCLNNYYENPTTGDTSFEKGGGAFAGGISAAQIIYNAAQTYGINPEVLLVMLKKESSGPLTSDTWPLKSQYTYAMGYACPDSGPDNSANCNAQQGGFYKQVMLAAWQLNYYRNHPNDYRYAVGLNSIQYSPDLSCGTTQVNIQNLATLSLYIYTPYVPNAASLANYPGTAPCGSYGNRNFFMYFSEWFGTTHGNVQINMLKADQNIDTEYANLQSQLGAATTDKVPDFSSVVRVWQNFTGGTIIWTPAYGAHAILTGPLYDRWRTLGGSTGTLGVPINSAVTESSDGRVWQSFMGGTIIYSSATGAWEMLNGPINDKWHGLGGSTGTLGRPTSAVVVATDGLRTQQFEKGVIARKNATSPAYYISGAIADTWNQSQSILGAPTNDPITESDGRVWQNFENGTIIQNTQGAAWIVRFGNIYNRWKQLGGSVGELGKPAGDQVTESDGRVWQNFENGTIIQKSAQTSAYEILFGPVYDRWKQLGGSVGELGKPAGNQVTESDGRVWQNFENGTIIWGNTTGAWDVQGNFYDFWKQHGGSLGELGKPTSARTIDSDGTHWQSFEKGKAVWRANTGWFIQLS